MQTTTPANKYLWNYEKLTWSAAPLTTYIEPIIIGIHGDKGDKGDTGPQGPQGIQGPAGSNGQSLYTWVKYADNASGSGMSDSPVGKTYIGLAYNKTTATESSSAGDYTWSLIQGPQGIQGPSGSNGQSLYTWIKYADTPTSGMNDSPAGKKYLGIAYNKTTATESTSYGDYSWSLIEGPQGTAGVSVTSVDVEYAQHTSATSAPSTGWNTAAPTWENGKYIWSRVKTTYSAGNPTYTNAACITGQAGSTGATGKGISSITEEYYLSTSKEDRVGGSWVTDPPTWELGLYMWTRSKIVYTNPSSTGYTEPVCDTAWEVVNDLSPQVTEAESMAAEARALLRDMEDDNRLTPSEKIRLYGEWATIQAEKFGIDTQLAFYGLTSSPERTAHDLAFSTMSNVFNDLFLDMTETSPVNGESIREMFVNYFVAKQNAMNKISNAEKARLDDIKNRTEALESEQEVTRNFMRIGDVKLGDGTIVYGIAIGKDVSTLNPDGTIKHTNASSISTATDYSFLVNGVKVGEFSNSGLKTDNIDTPSIEMGGKWRWRAGTDGRLTLRPM